jgi:cytidylate kinase
MKISITGDLGSGKSSVGKALSNKLDIEFLSSGEVFRKIAEKRNMTVLELNEMAKSVNWIDDEIDGALQELSTKDDDMIIDSRLAWYFVSDSFKVYIKVDAVTAAERILNANRGNVENYKCIEEAVNDIKMRSLVEIERYKEKYNVDLCDNSNYDLIIDSTLLDVEGVTDKILCNLEKYNIKI